MSEADPAGGRRGLYPWLALLAAILAAAWSLQARGLLRIAGAGGTEGGARTFGLTLAFFYAAAVACSLAPAARRPVVLGVSLVQLFVLFSPLEALGALAVWTAFYHLVHLPASWWLKAPAVASLYAAPWLLTQVIPGARILEILPIALATSNFVLRGLLYAYEATLKKSQIQSAGYAGFLLYLLAAPLSALKPPPVGFIVLHRGLGAAADPGLLRSGTLQIALGFLYLAAREAGLVTGLLPTYAAAAAEADEMNVVTVLAASHVLFLGFFLEVAGHVHVTIGMLRTLGFGIPHGMNRPYLSVNFLDFWRRWNTYYRDFLLTLAYYPVAMSLKRRPFVAVPAAGAAVFGLSGFTHALATYVREPEILSWKWVVGSHLVYVPMGALVVIWMVQETAAPRRRPRAGAEAPREETRDRVLHAVSIAGTLTVMAVILLLTFPLSVSSALRILAALARLP